MYYSISGTLIHKDENMAVIEAGGIAYEIMIPQSVFHKLQESGNTATLFTKMIVREDDIYLVGFLALEDRRLFESLMTVSGIGPKQSLKILSELTASEIRNAIITGNESVLSKVKGVGGKTASRIILELKDKIKKLQIGDSLPITNTTEKKKMEILMALRVLGYYDNESRRAIDSAFASSAEIKDKEVEDIIKIILSNMAR